MEAPWASGEAAVATLGTYDYVALAPAAAFYADGELGAPYPVDVGTLHGWLNDFLRDHDSRRRGATHVEPGTIHGRLYCLRLIIVKHLLLAGASRNREHGDNCDKWVREFHRLSYLLKTSPKVI
jgi:hypothetical protein